MNFEKDFFFEIFGFKVLRKKFNIPSDDDIYLWINKW